VKYAVEMGSGAIIYINQVSYLSSLSKADRGDRHIDSIVTARAYFFQIKKIWLKHEICRRN
jgi:hypothetical protein